MSDRCPGRTTVTTAAYGTRIERTETSNPDGSTTIIREVTSPSGGTTIEMESFPRGVLPPRLLKTEESSTTEEGGVILVTWTAIYSNGSKEIVRERKHPSGAIEVATERAQVADEQPALSEHGNGGASGKKETAVSRDVGTFALQAEAHQQGNNTGRSMASERDAEQSDGTGQIPCDEKMAVDDRRDKVESSESILRVLTSMGFSQAEAKKGVEHGGGSLEGAIAWILGQKRDDSAMEPLLDTSSNLTHDNVSGPVSNLETGPEVPSIHERYSPASNGIFRGRGEQARHKAGNAAIQRTRESSTVETCQPARLSPPATSVWDVEETEISENPQPLASTRPPSASRSRDEETKDEEVSAMEVDVIVPTATLVPDMVQAEMTETGETLAPALPTVSSRNQDMPGTVVQEDVNAEQVKQKYSQTRRFCRCSKKKAVAGALVLMTLAGVGVALGILFRPDNSSAMKSLATKKHPKADWYVSYGHMFDIYAFNDVNITAMDVHIQIEEGKQKEEHIKIWTTKDGSTYADAIRKSPTLLSWQLLVSARVIARGKGAMTGAPYFTVGIPIFGNTARGFYVTVATRNMLYQEDSETVSWNDDIEIRVGQAVISYELDAGSKFIENRAWSGIVHYKKA